MILFYLWDAGVLDPPPPSGLDAALLARMQHTSRVVFGRIIRTSSHGFVVGDLVGPVRNLTASPQTVTAKTTWVTNLLGWGKQIAAACLLAALIAAGQMIYTHFTKRWTEKGYPAIPIATLQMAANATRLPVTGQMSSTAGLGLGSGSAASASSPAAGAASMWDEFRG